MFMCLWFKLASSNMSAASCVAAVRVAVETTQRASARSVGFLRKPEVTTTHQVNAERVVWSSSGAVWCNISNMTS